MPAPARKANANRVARRKLRTAHVDVRGVRKNQRKVSVREPSDPLREPWEYPNANRIWRER